MLLDNGNIKSYLKLGWVIFLWPFWKNVPIKNGNPLGRRFFYGYK